MRNGREKCRASACHAPSQDDRDSMLIRHPEEDEAGNPVFESYAFGSQRWTGNVSMVEGRRRASSARTSNSSPCEGELSEKRNANAPGMDIQGRRGD